MANITRFDPFTDTFEDMVCRFFRPARWEGVEGGPIDIKVDVAEQNDAYLVKAEIPGVPEEDIHVQIDGTSHHQRRVEARERREGKGQAASQRALLRRDSTAASRSETTSTRKEPKQSIPTVCPELNCRGRRRAQREAHGALDGNGTEEESRQRHRFTGKGRKPRFGRGFFYDRAAWLLGAPADVRRRPRDADRARRRSRISLRACAWPVPIEDIVDQEMRIRHTETVGEHLAAAVRSCLGRETVAETLVRLTRWRSPPASDPRVLAEGGCFVGALPIARLFALPAAARIGDAMDAQLLVSLPATTKRSQRPLCAASWCWMCCPCSTRGEFSSG